MIQKLVVNVSKLAVKYVYKIVLFIGYAKSINSIWQKVAFVQMCLLGSSETSKQITTYRRMLITQYLVVGRWLFSLARLAVCNCLCHRSARIIVNCLIPSGLFHSSARWKIGAYPQTAPWKCLSVNVDFSQKAC